jgi:hypothetical protein
MKGRRTVCAVSIDPTPRRGAVVLLCAVQFVDVLGVTSATTAVPEMIRALGASPSAAALIITPYAMFFGGLLVLGARLGDRFGHRRILLTGIALFVVVSIAGSLSTDVLELMLTRALLGAAAAVSVPSSLRLLLAAAPEGSARVSALAGWSAAGAAAGAAGFVVGGLVTQLLDWRAVFWINAPIGLLLAAGVMVYVRPLAPIDSGRRLDVLGATLLILAVMGVVLGATSLERPDTRGAGLALLVLAVVFGAAFAFRQRRAREPLIPAAAFRSPPLRTGTLVSFVNTATTSSAVVLATLELQNELGLSPLAAGLSLVWLSLAVIGGAALTKPLAARQRSEVIGALGLATIALGNVVLSVTVGTVAGILVGTIVIGSGLGLASVAGTSIGTAVPGSLAGVASGVLNTGAQLGSAIGIAVVVLIATTTSPAAGWGVAAVAATATAAWLATRRVSGHS